MPTETCKVDGCGKSFTKSTTAKAKSALAMHKTMAHDYKRNTKAKRVRKKANMEVKFDFCPGCGLNLHRLAMGYVLAQKITIA